MKVIMLPRRRIVIIPIDQVIRIGHWEKWNIWVNGYGTSVDRVTRHTIRKASELAFNPPY